VVSCDTCLNQKFDPDRSRSRRLPLPNSLANRKLHLPGLFVSFAVIRGAAVPNLLLKHPIRMERPLGVTAIAVLFLLVSAYLSVVAFAKLVSPESVSLAMGAPLLHGLEIAGPFMFLLAAAVGGVVGFGLFRLNNLARRATGMIALAGIVMLIPKVSADAADFSPRFFIAGLMIAIRVMIVWYLWQSWTAEKFEK
jgi:hypothetical protein